MALLVKYAVIPFVLIGGGLMFGSSGETMAGITAAAFAPAAAMGVLFSWYAQADVALAVLLLLITTGLSIVIMPIATNYVIQATVDPSGTFAVETAMTEHLAALGLYAATIFLGLMIRQSSFKLGKFFINLGFGAAFLCTAAYCFRPYMHGSTLVALESEMHSNVLPNALGPLASLFLGHIVTLFFQLEPRQRRTLAVMNVAQNLPLVIHSLELSFPTSSLDTVSLSLGARYAIFIQMVVATAGTTLYSCCVRSFSVRKQQEGNHGLGLDRKARHEFSASMDALFASIKG